jgi:hypothetical protein
MLLISCYSVYGVSLWVLIWWMQPHHQVNCHIVVADEYSKLLDTIHYCVDISSDDSICSRDPFIALEHVYSKRRLNAFSVGVAQTIDGTEDEKNSIRNVLTQMNHYWYNEVLSNFEYDEARASW